MLGNWERLVAVQVALLGALSAGARVGVARQGSVSSRDSQTSPTKAETTPSKPNNSQPQSLGDLARQQRHARQTSQTPKAVYTNDNMPAAAGNLTILGSSEGQGGAEAAAGKENASPSAPGEDSYRNQYRDLAKRLDIDQRELAVLHQELGQNQIQYYSNPSQAMQQEYSRNDINRLRQAIDEKQQQVDADQQALSDVEDVLRRQGSEPGGIKAAPSAGPLPSAPPDLSGVPKRSEEYWRRRFSAARQALAWAQEERQLAEDELSLLQSQQAHDWGTPAATSAEPKVAAKQSEVDDKRAAEAKAQQELDALEKEFQQSGSPEEWSKPDTTSPDSAVPQTPDV
jgi:hypothetical protein